MMAHKHYLQHVAGRLPIMAYEKPHFKQLIGNGA